MTRFQTILLLHVHYPVDVGVIDESEKEDKTA